VRGLEAVDVLIEYHGRWFDLLTPSLGLWVLFLELRRFH
jgi:hypothetical protein